MAQKNQSGIPRTQTSGISESHPGWSTIDTQKQNRPRKTWRQALQESAPLVLPVAHDALTARLIELAGYPAYQIGTTPRRSYIHPAACLPSALPSR